MENRSRLLFVKLDSLSLTTTISAGGVLDKLGVSNASGGAGFSSPLARSYWAHSRSSVGGGNEYAPGFIQDPWRGALLPSRLSSRIDHGGNQSARRQHAHPHYVLLR